MLITTTHSVEGKKVSEYLGVVAGEAIIGVNIFRDLFASIRDLVGGRTQSYERVLGDARNMAQADLIAQAKELGADAVIGVDIDYEVLGKGNGMLMVSMSGTAVKMSS
jgi:uncharacterized protein YbjQ (UPF0145 family)